MAMNNTKLEVAMIGLKGLPAVGGAAAVGENIIDNLKDKYQFTVYSISSHTDLKTGINDGYKQIVFEKLLPGKLNIIYYYLLSAIHCLFSDYDGVHLHHNVTGFINFILKFKYPTIYTSHSSKIRNNFRQISGLIKYAEKLSVRHSTAITAVAKTTYNSYSKIRSNDLYYIPNGVNELDTSIYSNKNNNYIMFSAGRILPSKGCHLLLQAADQINYSGKIVIAGNNDYSLEYKTELEVLSRTLNTSYLGLIREKDKLFEYIKCAKYFVFPSTIEAMSMMLLEVASLKTPLICSDIEENRVIFNNNEVLYFDSGNYQDLAEKMEFAEKNPDVMEDKARRAYDKVISEYQWENIAQKYHDLYQQYF